MKIAILGTRGIPNHYGGWEQNAENLSVWFVKYGHEVTIYSPDIHPYTGSEWNGVKIKKIFSREDIFGVLGVFIFDFLCLLHVVRQDFDIILELGYAPSGLFYFLKRRKTVIVTNMDGLDWKRTKWNKLAKWILLYCERKVVLKSDAIIADNLGIKDYFFNKYGVDSTYIGYGVSLGYGVEERVFRTPKEEYLTEFGLKKYGYYLMIGRLEPENNIEMMVDGYLKSGAKDPLIAIAKHNEKYREFLIEKYKKFENVKFIGGIYNRPDVLNTIRYYSKLYFHGHMVGGTNPSLIEAMSAGALIASHENVFNKNVLLENAFYFNNSEELSNIILTYDENRREIYKTKNYDRINNEYNWEINSKKYLDLFEEVHNKKILAN
jgi:glycosyltransferase involved in cell wall biosynthesis